jgi:tartrate-resistant acid phosphatase type 5
MRATGIVIVKVTGILLLPVALLALLSAATDRTAGTSNRQVPREVYAVRPALPTPGAVRFAVIGDYGWAGQPALDVASLVHSWSPEFVITLGDNNYQVGSASTIDANIGQYYHDFIYPYYGSYGQGADINRFFPSLGNHDWETTGAQPYLDYFTLPGNERYYSFTWGPVDFFAIDSDVREPDGITQSAVQAQWLQASLAGSTSPWKLVYLHHPPYSSGGGHGNTPDLQWSYRQWGASAVLAGHDHDYERIILNGFPYFVNGLGGRSIYSFGTPVPGSMVRYNADYGVMLVDATSTSINFRFYSRANTLVDTYTINLNTPTPTTTPTRTATPAVTSTPTATRTATTAPTSTFTPNPNSLLVGHVNWQGPPAQPDARQQLPVTLTLKLGAVETNYPWQNTDGRGFFTVSVGSLANGTYNWRAKGPRYLATSGTLVLSGVPAMQVEMGLMRAGDANGDNLVGVADFNILRESYGSSSDFRADFNNDLILNVIDFSLLRGSFGTGGAPPLNPRPR